MDIGLVVGGALFVVWPFQHQRSMRRVERRIAARGGDVERFKRSMDRRWIIVLLRGAPVVGVALVALGLVGF
jgi:hypothetical protein